MSAGTERLAAALQPLISRVRTDITAAKSNGRQLWTKQSLTPERIAEHLNGGPARGVCVIKEGESVTMVGMLDLDSHKGESTWGQMTEAAHDVMISLEMLGGAPVAFRSSGGKGIHLYCLWDEPQDAYSVRDWLAAALQASGFRNGTKGVAEKQIEVFPKQSSVPVGGNGSQAILPFAGASVPLVWDDLVGDLVPVEREEFSVWPMSEPVPRVERPVHVSQATASTVSETELKSVVDAIPNAGEFELEYNDWRDVMFGIQHETAKSDFGLRLLHDFSAKSSKYDETETDYNWGYTRSEGRGAVIGIGTIRRIAARYGWTAVPVSADVFDDVSELDPRPPGEAPQEPALGAREAAASRNPEQSNGLGLGAVAQMANGTRAAVDAHHAARVQSVVQARVPEKPVQVRSSDVGIKRRGVPEAHYLTTDQANANRLAKAFGSHVFVAADHWHVWDGKRWKMDDADVNRYGCQLSDLIRAEAMEVKARASANPDPAAIRKAAEIAEALLKWAQKSEMAGTINAALGLVRKMLTVDAGQLDRDPWLLNVANGTVDLRTGELQRHNAADYITKLVPVAYRADAAAPTWERVLREITREDGGGGAPVAAFLQRWFGYCLTGLVVEQAFVVHWGSGSNGKSTVLGLMADTLGDYAGSAPPGLMAASKGDRHPTEIASLMGRRMVTAHESADGVVLREDFVKQATGDDVLTARYMRGDFFDFPPTHKLQLLTNHKPQVKGTDPGIWRRVILVPYVASFGSAEGVAVGTHTHVRDLGMVKRLRSELEGVLAWRVRGAVEWAQGGGLAPPEVVRVASAEYRSEQDRVGQFVAECCERMPANASADEAKRWGEPLTVGGDLGIKSGLYPTYVAWCKEGGVFPLSKSRFRDDVLRVVGASAVTVRKAPVENGRRRDLAVVPGLRLLTD